MLPEDAPDPRAEMDARLRNVPFPVYGLVEQPSLEDTGAALIEERTGSAGGSSPSALTVGINYTLWRNPDDHDDPANLLPPDGLDPAVLDNRTPWGRPAWLVDMVDRMRYPQLWEAVRTNWRRDDRRDAPTGRRLVDHANHILRNVFRAELGIRPGPNTRGAWQVAASALRPASLEVDGVAVAGVEVDTDPLVYAIGARLRPNVTTTVVVAREYLPFIRVALSTRAGNRERPGPAAAGTPG